MQDGCRVYMDSHMASNGSSFMATWIICKKIPPFGGRPNTKLGDHNTLNTHNRWFVLCYHVVRTCTKRFQWNSIWLRDRSHMTSDYTWISVTTLHDFGSVLGQPPNTFFWALQFHGHGSWLMCEVALNEPRSSFIESWFWTYGDAPITIQPSWRNIIITFNQTKWRVKGLVWSWHTKTGTF